MNDTIAAILKQLRNESHISVKQAVALLKNYDIDIASKTIYGYESGLSMPNADVFLALCQIYRSGSRNNARNTAAEARLEHSEKNTTDTDTIGDAISFLNDYQMLDAFGKDIVQKILQHEKERMRQMHP